MLISKFRFIWQPINLNKKSQALFKTCLRFLCFSEHALELHAGSNDCRDYPPVISCQCLFSPIIEKIICGDLYLHVSFIFIFGKTIWCDER